MSAINWNEITNRAYAFVKEHEDMSSERSEAIVFWRDLLEVFGVKASLRNLFEHAVANLKGHYSRIDMFWEGVVLVEHKSRGKDLTRAESQAFSYIQDLARTEPHKIPRYVILCDFANFLLYDLTQEPIEDHVRSFPLEDLPKHVKDFGFFINVDADRPLEQEDLNLKAVELLGSLHDVIEDAKYPREHLDTYMMRLLFCLFADDTGILNHQMERVLQDCNPDGAETGRIMQEMFDVLNTPKEARQSTMDSVLRELEYINGGLFNEHLPLLYYSREMHQKLLECARFDWGLISPVVFGALFQAIMDPRERRQYGAHYTSERDILKVIRPLFLDDLLTEFATVKTSKAKLEQFHRKLASLRFLDPACGCGNFLMIAYRELRRLEMEVVRALYPKKEWDRELLDVVEQECLVNVDQFYGIEIEEWPARIAEVAMWLMDHVMNLEFSKVFGGYYNRLPLTAKVNIHHGNALRIDWNEVLPREQCSYVLGNPPFVGKKARSKQQAEDMDIIFKGIKNYGVLDYVTCWYKKAAEYMADNSIPTAFVSTNSITQGEQPGILFVVFDQHTLCINFAYRTFAWESEAKGKAHVHVVIIGFSRKNERQKFIFEDDQKETVTNINLYLIEGGNEVVHERKQPLSPVPLFVFGNMPNDDQNLLLTDEEAQELSKDSCIEPYIRPIISAREYIHGVKKCCLWLKDAPPSAIKSSPDVYKRVEAVKTYRSNSTREATKKLAAYPTLFGEIRQPETNYILIPRHSSEKRAYIPMSLFSPESIVHDSCACIPDATLYHFGIMISLMHMVWVRTIGGRIKSDYRYSGGLVYNTFPWPTGITPETEEKIGSLAQAVLDTRAKHPNATLADLYDPNSMPPDLVKAHAALDRAVDRAYRKEPFTSERERVEYLFGLYQRLVADEKTKK